MKTRTTQPKAATKPATSAKRGAAVARLKAEDHRAYADAQHVAGAWASAVRVKVRELVAEARMLDAITGRPGDKPAEGLMLRCILNPDGINRFVRAAYELEESLDALFAGDAEPVIPDLAGAIRRAADAYRAAAAAEVDSTEVAPAPKPR